MNRSILRAHPWTAAVLAVSLVGVIVLGGASASQAAIWPKGFNPKQYMLNILGSMLAGTNPDGKLGPAKQAVIQADQQYDHSWEGLEEMWKKDATKVPGTYQDYVLQRQEYFNDKGIKGIEGQKATETNTGKGTKYVKPMKAPATKLKSFVRNGVGAGLGIGASVGWAYRADIGSGVAGLFGVDAQGAVCSNRDSLGVAASAVDFITGQDCDAWQMDQAYDPNLDVVAREPGWANYPVPYSCGNNDDLSTCYQIFTVKPQPTKATGEQTFTLHAGTKKAQNIILNYYCQSASGEKGYATSQKGFYDPDQESQTYTVDCGADHLYMLSVQSGSYATDPSIKPDGALFAQSYRERTWYSDLSPNYVPGTSSNPDRTFLCTYTLADGSTVEKETDTFKETDAELPSPVCPAADTDQAVKGVDVAEVNKDTGEKQSIYDADTTGQYQDWFTKYPECREGACSLDLLKNNSTSATSCFASDRMNDACIDWMSDPDKSKNYQCMYGAHKVDISECYVYANVFDPEKVLAGSAYSDPTTGESVDGQSSPNAAQKALGRDWTDPQDFRGCLDNGWAKVNPVEWVMIPVQCSLQWAFAPSTQVVVTTTNKVVNEWASKAPGKIANAVSSWSITAPGGCDIPVKVMGQTIDLSPACPGQPLEQVAMLSKIATTAIVCVLCFFACRRIVRSWIGDNDSGDGGSER